jgi:2-polyprenyl-6-methoxyphenol hydroxylase-like FAD-dependent oxidoreductase
MSNQQSSRSGFGGQHAVVIGASMAGLLASRVLSEHFEQVTVIERDQLPQEVQARKGVPQGRHVHILLHRGASILQDLFPDLFPALLQDGSIAIDTVADFHWYNFGAWKPRFRSGITFYSQSRPLLEGHVRERVAARSNVRFLDACDVVKLCATDDATQITGVQIRHRQGEPHEEVLSADLIVDASGRGSQTPQWLAALGYDTVEENTIKVDVGYATRIYRRPEYNNFDHNVLAVYSTPPAGKRAGVLAPIEGNRWIVTMIGWIRDYPPDDEAGVLAFARSLPQPDLYEAIQDAEPLTPIAIHKFPANRRRHYERLARFPEGFVALGDALCSFNPVYGQGMTAAALEAETLNTLLYRQRERHPRGDITGFSRRFQKKITKIVDTFWLLAASEDFRHPETQGNRPLGVNLLNRYARRVHELSTFDPRVTLLLYQVLQAIKPPTALFSPRILTKVLFKRAPRQSEQAGTSASPEVSGDTIASSTGEHEKQRQTVSSVPEKIRSL